MNIFLLTVILLAPLLQPHPIQRPTIVASPSTGPHRNYWIIYYDDAFLFAARNYGDERDFGGNTTPGLFVHSKEKDRWIQILEISTAGGSFGSSESDDSAARRKLMWAPVGWSFTAYASRQYIEQPLRTSGSIAFPERIAYDSGTGRYQLRFMSSWNVPSAETVLLIRRADLVAAFATP